jgi:hypothetical protein
MTPHDGLIGHFDKPFRSQEQRNVGAETDELGNGNDSEKHPTKYSNATS